MDKSRISLRTLIVPLKDPTLSHFFISVEACHRLDRGAGIPFDNRWCGYNYRLCMNFDGLVKS
jgi:hypothetical protein